MGYVPYVYDKHFLEQMFFGCMVLHDMTQETGKEIERLGMKVVSTRLSKTGRGFSRTLILYSRRRCYLKRLLVLLHTLLGSVRESSRERKLKMKDLL